MYLTDLSVSQASFSSLQSVWDDNFFFLSQAITHLCNVLTHAEEHCSRSFHRLSIQIVLQQLCKPLSLGLFIELGEMHCFVCATKHACCIYLFFPLCTSSLDIVPRHTCLTFLSEKHFSLPEKQTGPQQSIMSIIDSDGNASLSYETWCAIVLFLWSGHKSTWAPCGRGAAVLTL